MSADVRYARNGRVAVAHQILGDGPIDLVLVPGFASHLDVMWEEPRLAVFLDLLAARARLILYDAREQGLSDRLGRAPTLAEHVDEARACVPVEGVVRRRVIETDAHDPVPGVGVESDFVWHRNLRR